VLVRLEAAQLLLPRWLRLSVVEGHRTPAAQRSIIEAYRREVVADHPTAADEEIGRLVSRHVAPLHNAPHLGGAAIDVTLVDAAGAELWMGTPIDATPEQSGGRCYTDAADLDARASAHRALLCGVLSRVGFVNYPPEWWHWSYGDRYWAYVTGAGHATYGPVER
jgi:D-alanyl-D-alanine dipeptidase